MEVYHSNPPSTCDACEGAIGTVFSDARLQGRWGNFCHSCTQAHRIQFGTGRGQLYRKQADGRYLKVKG